MMNLAFLVSNNGSSLRAVVAAIADGKLAARARLVVSNRAAAPALAFAAERGIPTLCLPTVADPEGADARLCDALDSAKADLVILSGYLRRLGPITLGAYAGRVLNIHPALLPNYGGKGMYERRVHEAVIAARETETGATVHVVDDQYDHGPVVAQARISIGPNDTAETIEARVMAEEPGLFIRTLNEIAAGRLVLPRITP